MSLYAPVSAFLPPCLAPAHDDFGQTLSNVTNTVTNTAVNAAALLAFDYGAKRIGIAIGNTLTRRARALTVIANRNRASCLTAIAELISAWQPQALVVGLPIYPDGAPHPLMQPIKRFCNQLTRCFGLPVRWVDERYSSRCARAMASTPVDAEAARIILQQYFDEYACA